MCAAPGSKTTQLIERLGDQLPPGTDASHGDTGGEEARGGTPSGIAPGGVVVANDLDSIRCHTLIKRTSRYIYMYVYVCIYVYLYM